MAFWGIEVKPGKPYTHSAASKQGRLRISQATLGIGTATIKSLVQCNVGDSRPVLLCALLPNKTESLQLDLEFDEAEDVMFSVIGPRGVYLTGYYVGHKRSNLQDDSESFGEDIANSETMESNHNTDEDEYDDSFINDDEPEPLTPSPVSSTREDDDEDDIINKKRNGNGGHKRLKKRYQSIESDDDISVPDIDDEDNFPISSICKNNKSQGSGEKNKIEVTAEADKETKNNDDLDSKDKVVVDLVNDDTTEKGVQQNTSMPSLAEVVPESKLKTKKKKRDSSKEEKTTDVLAAQDDQKTNKETTAEVTKIDDDKHKSEGVNSRVLRSKHNAYTDLVDGEINRNKPSISVPSLAEVVPESKSKKKKKKQESSKEQKGSELAAKDEPKTNDTVADCSLEVLDSTEVEPEKNSKPKKRKSRREVNLLTGNNQEDDQPAIDKSSCNDCKQLANGDQSEEKKIKKKKRKMSKTQEADENTDMGVEKENNKPSASEPEGKNENSGSCNKKTLSNGLVIEDIVTSGNLKGKVAAAGKKVKVQYIVKLKENGQVIDSNGKSPHKLRLGDKDVIEGLNVGLDGMRVGDKRRITIPPSMSLGYKGTGENVPPNSWLIYDVEMTSIH